MDEVDREVFLEVLAEVIEQLNWTLHAYCLMSSHDHLLGETPDGNLSKGMRQLNGVYTQRFNRRHGRVGHALQGRYKGIIVQKQSLLELACYIVLNPVRARNGAQRQRLALRPLPRYGRASRGTGMAGDRSYPVHLWRAPLGSSGAVSGVRGSGEGPTFTVDATKKPDLSRHR